MSYKRSLAPAALEKLELLEKAKEELEKEKEEKEQQQQRQQNEPKKFPVGFGVLFFFPSLRKKCRSLKTKEDGR